MKKICGLVAIILLTNLYSQSLEDKLDNILTDLKAIKSSKSEFTLKEETNEEITKTTVNSKIKDNKVTGIVFKKGSKLSPEIKDFNIYVDHKKVEDSMVELKPGRHHFKVFNKDSILFDELDLILRKGLLDTLDFAKCGSFSIPFTAPLNVTVDGIPIGKLPIENYPLPVKMHKIKISDDNGNVFDEKKIKIEKDLTDSSKFEISKIVFDKELPALVMINEKTYNISESNEVILTPGEYDLSIFTPHKVFLESRRVNLGKHESKLYQYNFPKIEYQSDNDISVEVDGIKIKERFLNLYPIPEGEHDFTVYDDSFNKVIDEDRFRVENKKFYSAEINVDKRKINKPLAVSLSVFFPGVGQLYSGRYYSGLINFSSCAATAGWLAVKFLDYEDRVNKYNENETDADLRKNKYVAETEMIYSAGFFAIAYAVNLIDAIYFTPEYHSTATIDFKEKTKTKIVPEVDFNGEKISAGVKIKW